MSKKLCFRGPFDKKTWQMRRNTVAISTTEPLQYLLITVEIITLENVSFSDIKNRKTVCLQIDCT